MNVPKYLILLAILVLFTQLAQAQYTRQDTLRGKLSPLRTCYDVYFYDLALRVNPDEKSIKGSSAIHFKVVEDFQKMQIDLFENLSIEKILYQDKPLQFVREGNATFIDLGQTLKKGDKASIEIHYGGKPRPARRAPWDGGFSWKKDKNNHHWIGVSCEGLGASVWWPNKDHLSEESDSMRIACEVPSELWCIANGQDRGKTELADGYTRYEWFVSYPINNYNVTLNIGKYAHFSEVYVAQDGDSLDLDYYVLEYNLEKAKKQFEQVKPMLACYEKYFGKYPFWKDGFALVETPYLGMEHQGAVAYGNEYKQGYLGTDLTGSGHGLKFDYIIIHEVGHEYWGNSVSCKDHAELWIHESFCTYTEGLYVECMFGKEAGYEYLYGYTKNIGNRQPIIAPLDVNADGSGDMYPKGAVMLHTLRNVVNNDKKWFQLLMDISQDFKIKNTDTDELVAYISKKLGTDYTYFFDQYLRNTSVPVLEYTLETNKKNTILKYRWRAEVSDFKMPVQIQVAEGKYEEIRPTTTWQEKSFKTPLKELTLKPKSYYVLLEKK